MRETAATTIVWGPGKSASSVRLSRRVTVRREHAQEPRILAQKAAEQEAWACEVAREAEQEATQETDGPATDNVRASDREATRAVGAVFVVFADHFTTEQPRTVTTRMENGRCSDGRGDSGADSGGGGGAERKRSRRIKARTKPWRHTSPVDVNQDTGVRRERPAPLNQR